MSKAAQQVKRECSDLNLGSCITLGAFSRTLVWQLFLCPCPGVPGLVHGTWAQGPGLALSLLSQGVCVRMWRKKQWPHPCCSREGFWWPQLVTCVGQRPPEVRLGSPPTQLPPPSLSRAGRQAGGSCAGTCQSVHIR